MRKEVLWSIIGVVILMGMNLYYYIDTFKWQIKYQSDFMSKQMDLCSGHIGDFFDKSSINLMMAITPNEMDCLFKTKCNMAESNCRVKSLGVLYGPNLKSLTVSEPNGQFYKISRSRNNSFVTEYGEAEPQNYFRPAIFISPDDNLIEYMQPLVQNGRIYGFVSMGINLEGYFKTVLQHFVHDKNSYQYMIMPNGDIAYQQGAQNSLVTSISPEMLNNIDGEYSFIHNVKVDNQDVKVLSVIKKIDINRSNYFLVFSISKKEITATIVRNSFIVGAVTIAVLILYIVFIIIQSIQRTRREQRMEKTQETLRRVLYYLPVGVVLTDSKGVVQQVNKAALQLFNYSSEDELMGCVYNDQLLCEHVKLTNKIRVSINTVRYKVEKASGNSMMVFSERIPFFIDNDSLNINAFVVVADDEGNISKSDEGNDAQNNFMANISHELRTPLNGIIGMADIMAKMNLGEEERDMLKIISNSADSLLVLINDILDFSRANSGRMFIESVPFNLVAEIDDAIESFAFVAKDKKIKLWWYSSIPITGDFEGDPLRLRQVLNNLIGNALKFTSRGEVVLHITKGRLINGNEGVRFEIHDTGVGINKSVIDRVFEPFWQEDTTTTRVYGGTGLGTTISRQMVALMGGEISVNSPSAISKDSAYPGTSFVFTIPLIACSNNKKYMRSSVKRPSDIHVAVITDDEREVRQLTRVLQSFNIGWEIMDSSGKSLMKLRSDKFVNTVIIDHRADFDGLAFLQLMHVEKIDRIYPILVQSSDTPSQNSNMVRRLGVDSYLRKPVKSNLLRNFFLAHFDVDIPIDQVRTREEIIKID